MEMSKNLKDLKGLKCWASVFACVCFKQCVWVGLCVWGCACVCVCVCKSKSDRKLSNSLKEIATSFLDATKQAKFDVFSPTT